MIVKIPLINALGKTDGCENAPDAVLKVIEELFTNENAQKVSFDVGAIGINNSNLEESNQKIFNEAKQLFGQGFGQRIVFLGGDHSLSYSTVKAFFSSYEDAGLLVLDAHADCVHNFSPPTHEDWLRRLIEEEIVPANRVLIIGLRNLFEGERDFLNLHKINSFSCKEIFDNGIEDSAHVIMEIIREWKALYLSIDIDIVDPAFAPAVSYPEPCGLSSRELIFLIQKLLLVKNLKAADITEINPTKDAQMLTTKLGAKIALELLS